MHDTEQSEKLDLRSRTLVLYTLSLNIVQACVALFSSHVLSHRGGKKAGRLACCDFTYRFSHARHKVLGSAPVGCLDVQDTPRGPVRRKDVAQQRKLV